MAYAYDFNRVPGPSADEIKAHDGEGVLTYGTGRQQDPSYLANLDAAGIHTVLIWEHNIDSILFMDGADECQRWEATHPAGELVYLACDLNDGALGGRDVTRFCREWASVTREPAFGLYGSSTCIAQGQAAGIPKLSRWWGVVNWIVGGGPDNAPGNIRYWQDHGAHIVQLIGSPIPDTDQNLILKADWWTTGGTPTQPTEDDDDMPHIAYLKNLDGTTGMMLVDGGYMTHDFGVAPNGVPVSSEYMEWRNEEPSQRADFKTLRYNGVEWGNVRKRSGV